MKQPEGKPPIKKVSDVASGMHMPAPVAFSVPNDIGMAESTSFNAAKDKKRKRRKKKVKSFLEHIMIKNSTGLTSTPISTVLTDSYQPDGGLEEHGVILGFEGSMPGMIPAAQEDFVNFFGAEGFGQDNQPPVNYYLNPLRVNKRKKRKKRLKKLRLLGSK